MKSQFLTIVLCLGLFLSGSLNVSASVGSAENKDVIDEMWGVPTFVYGSALSVSQVEETKSLLGISGESTDLKVTGEDMVRFLGSGNPNANMYSSALISGNDNKGGILVEIVTPKNITKVSMNQYANALITAGVSNVTVKVASPVKVTGESALTGVYLAYENEGNELDSESMFVAQEELSTVIDIVENSQGVEGFNEESLNLALIEIKQKIAEARESNPELTQEVTELIVKEALENNGLDSVISEEDVKALYGLAEQYINLDNLMSEEMQEQLTTLAKDVGSKASELAKELGGKAMETLQDEGFWESIKNFFSGVIDFIAGLFGAGKEEVETEGVITN